MNPILADMFRHNLWANLKLIDRCAMLPDGIVAMNVPGTFGTIRDTLTHIAGAEERYLPALAGGPERRNPTLEETAPDITTVGEHLRQSGEGLVGYVESVEGDPMLQVTWRGQTHEMPASLFLVQAINHATEHRSQVNTALTQAGVTPLDLDGWAWDAARKGQSA